jgi:hypothetical protein
VPENEPDELEIPSFMRSLKLTEISKGIGEKNTAKNNYVGDSPRKRNI